MRTLWSMLALALLGGGGWAAQATDAVTNGLCLNFRNAPLGLVLDYLADAAGFIINKETEVQGTVEVFSKEPVSREEAVALLNSALKRNGCALVRQGRVLTLVSRDSAQRADLEVVSGNDPEAVPKSDEWVTQVIPVRFATASQLVGNLQVLLPAGTTLSANESANSLILVASQTDIRRMLRIVRAIDTSLSQMAGLHVFALRHAEAKQVATLLQQLFAGSGASQNRDNVQNPLANFFPGGPGGPGGPPGFGPLGSPSEGGSAPSRSGVAAKVVSVADEYSNSLIVSSPPGLFATISNVVQQLDQPVTDVTEVRAFHLVNADPAELADQIAQLFPETGRSDAAQEQTPFRFGAPPGPFAGGAFGGAEGGESGSSERLRKKGRVIAVADRRSSAVLVSASGALMPHLAKLIAELDANPAKREQVRVFSLRNASVQQVSQVLQDLFNRNNLQRGSSRNAQPNADVLATRQTEQPSQAGSGLSNFGLGNSGASGNTGGGMPGGN